MTASPAIVGLGDPVMDIIAHVTHDFLSSVTSEPGGCIGVSLEEMQKMLAAAASQSSLKRIPGGSAANVMKGLANISGSTLNCRFVGMIGNDATGAEYRRELAAQHVVPVLLESNSGAPSACALCLVTPDGQRTMRTCLGASLELQQASQLPPSWADGIKLLHCEGYCLYRPSLTKELTLAAKRQGALVSIDLASFELVRHCKDSFVELLRSGCLDLLFANQEEAVALADALALTAPEADHQTKLDAAQDFLLQYVKVSVISLGPKGCIARAQDGSRGASDAAKVKVVDTIGAGDCFTAGFLYAYLQGADLQKCSASGCAAGAQSVQTEGAELPEDAWAQLRSNISSILGTQVSEVAHAPVLA